MKNMKILGMVVVAFSLTIMLSNAAHASGYIRTLETTVVNNIVLPEDTCENGVDNMSVIRFITSKRTKIMRCTHNGDVGDTFFYEVNRRNHGSAYLR